MNKIKYKNRTMIYGKSKNWKGKITFSTAPYTLESWTGGISYKLIWELEVFGYKLNFWRKLK